MVEGCHFQAFWVGSNPFKSNFFIFLEQRKKNLKFREKIVFFFRKIGDFSSIFLLPIFPSQNRFQPNRKPICHRKIRRKNDFCVLDGNHIRARSLAAKTLRQGYYWPAMLKDATELVKKCKFYQEHAQISHIPSESLT